MLNIFESFLENIKVIKHKLTDDEYEKIVDELDTLQINIIQPELEYETDPDFHSMFFYISDLSLELIKEIQNKFHEQLQKEYNDYHEKTYLFFIDIENI